MNVFVSWSGKVSESLAQQLKTWLSLIIQQLDVFVSVSDIDAGTRWAFILGQKLQETNFGIICITQENTVAPWLLFEAGALSKLFGESRVVPILFDTDVKDLASPLQQFQAKSFSKAGVWEIIQTLNKSLNDKALASEQLKTTFEAFWPSLESAVQKILVESKLEPVVRKAPELPEIMNETKEMVSLLLDKLGDLTIQMNDVESNIDSINTDLTSITSDIDDIQLDVRNILKDRAIKQDSVAIDDLNTSNRKPLTKEEYNRIIEDALKTLVARTNAIKAANDRKPTDKK